MAHSDFHIRDSAPATLTALLTMRGQCQRDEPAFAFLADGETVSDQITYGELDTRARQIAGLLRAQGIVDDRVLLLYPPGLDYIAAFFGCLYAGATAVPAYPPHRNRSLDRLLAVIGDACAGTVLCTDDVRQSIGRSFAQAPSLQALKWLATDHVEAISAEPYCDPTVTADRLAFLQYTSGSTSAPKGVMLTHGNLFHNATQITEGFQLAADSQSVFWLPLYHDMGLIGGVLQPLQVGRVSYLMAPATFLGSPIRWLRAISLYRATISGGPNFAYDLCARRVTPEQKAGLDLTCWRVAFNGSEPVHAETLERFAATFADCGFRRKSFYPCYGLAEATLFVTGGDHDSAPAVVTVSRPALEQNRIEKVVGNGSPDLPPPTHHSPSTIRTLVSCGAALGGQRVVIVHPETLRPNAADEPGEVWVAGPSVAQGYWQGPEETERTFRAFTAGGDGPFLRTGDLAFIHDGELYITGRLKDLIILRGRNHYPQDIELTVERSHGALRPATGAAFAVEAEGRDERLVIVHEIERTSRNLPTDEIIAAIRQAVAEQHEVMVDAVVLLKPGSTPKTSSGKIQRHACKAGYLDGTLEVIGAWEAPVEPESTSASAAPVAQHAPGHLPSAEEVRAFLTECIARKLRVSVESLDPREPLARYGLDSLTAVQLAGDLEQWLGRPLSPVLVYDHPTIEALANHLATFGGTTEPQIPKSIPGEVGRRPSDSVSWADRAVAVIGIGCRFPGADGPTAFWQLLRDGVDAITEVPQDRWDVHKFYSPDGTEPGTMNTRWGGFLRDVDRFDRAFFGIAPREAERMDPQQRLLLEVAYEALEDAGQNVERLAGRPVGVFVGISSNDYGRLQAGDPAAIDAYVGTGNALSIAANRLSYAFDFRGPSLAVDTACSSSLVAIHLACQCLRRGESDLAVAAGVNLILSPELTVNFTRAGMMAPDGRCKAFDVAANGYVRSEGVGVVILKPLSQALADGDPIYAVVRGSAVNQDGRSNGLTAPNRQSQEAVLRAAYRDAGISPADIDLIEAHGTGTSLGDPIEALALGSVLAEGRSADRPALLGSVKTNIGHLEAAAGVAGFVKLILSLKHGEVPPSLHYREPNPHIQFDELPLHVVSQLQPWPKRGRPRRAGVSSFGFGGTNAHIVLEAPPEVEGLPLVSRANEGRSVAAAPGSADGIVLVPISARSPDALRVLAQAWADAVEHDSGPGLPDLAHTAAQRRSHHDQRLAIAARTRDDLSEQLRAWLAGTPRAGTSSGRHMPNRQARIVFVFGGQGPQWWGMGRQLLDQEPVFRDAIDRCDAAFRPLAGWSLAEELRSQNDPAKLDDTDRVQPVLFALQIGLAELWRSWAVMPAAVVGHSLGEVAAAYIAGAISLSDAVQVVYHRGRLQQQVSGRGKMAAVGLSADESADALRGYEGRVALAAVNGPHSSVWSGEPAALDEALRPLRERDVFHRKLRGQVAFHSLQMMPLHDELVAALHGVAPKSGAVPFFSTVTGEPASGESLDAMYWGRNLCEPVRFAAAAGALIANGFDLFLEIGPHPVLTDSLNQCLGGNAGRVLASLRRGEDERHSLLAALGTLYVSGLSPDWDKITPAGARVAALPSYPWQRERCWHEVAPRQTEGNGFHTNGHTNGYTNGYSNGHAKSHTNGHTNGSTNGHSHTPVVPADAWLVLPAWETLAPPAKAPVLRGQWLIVADNAKVAARLQTILLERGAANVIVAGDECDASDPAQCHGLIRESVPAPSELTGVVYLAAQSAPQTDALTADLLTAAQDRGAIGLLHIVQALVARGVAPRLWVVTRGVQAVVQGEASAVAHAPLWGLGRSLANENPDLDLTLIDLDPTPSAADLTAIVASLGMSTDEPQLAWRDGRLLGARLVLAAGQVPSAAPVLRADATYLVTGGLGGLGLQVAQWMVARGARSLVLVGRSGPSGSADDALLALRATGARVVAARADVTDPSALAAVLDDIDMTLSPLRGIVHAAGVLDDGIALQLDRTRVWNVLAPKLRGAWHLHALTAARKLDFFVLFSSAASVLGSPGQANYAAANAFLDALAAYRQARNLPAVSINWGPWSGAGMASRDARVSRPVHFGLRPIDPAVALELFGRLRSAQQPQVGVLHMDWSALEQMAPGGKLPALFARLSTSVSTEPAVKMPSALSRAALRKAPPDDWQAIIEGQLREQAARVLRLSATALDVEQPLNNVGIDSLMAIELKNRIESDLGVTVPMVKFLEGPSVRELAEVIAAAIRAQGLEIESLGVAEPPAGPPVLTCGKAGNLLDNLDSLSDDQVDALLHELYAAEKGDG